MNNDKHKYSQVVELAYKPLALPIIGEMGMYNTITGSNPVLTTIASRFDGRVKVPLLEKSIDSWKDSNIVRWRNAYRQTQCPPITWKTQM